jgi:hypothetical protein
VSAAEHQHAAPARRVLDRVSRQVSKNPVQQDRVTEDRITSRDDVKLDPFRSCRFGEFRFELRENGTERHGLMVIAGGELAQAQGLDQLVQFVCQLPRRILGASELRLRRAAMGDSSQQIVRTDDHLQRLAQIVPGHRQ